MCFEKQVKSVLQEYAKYERDSARLHSELVAYELSEEFHQRIVKLIKTEYLKGRISGIGRKALAVGACIAFIVMILNPSVYVNAARRLYEFFDNYYRVQFEEKVNIQTIPEYRLMFVPEGWELQDEYYDSSVGGSWYSNDKDEIIDFSYEIADCVSFINNEGVVYIEFTDKKGRTIYYLKAYEDRPSTMQWLSEDRTTMFTLAAYLPREEMEKMIDSIEIIDEEE